MNKLDEQARLVKEALRAGKKVAIAVPRQRMFERIVKDMLPEDLPIAARPSRMHFKFKNGAILSFIPSWSIDAGRGARYDVAWFYDSIQTGYPASAVERERERRLWDLLAETVRDAQTGDAVNESRPPTALQIDDACRDGLVVLHGSRRVIGAVKHRQLETTINGRIWVKFGDDLTWHYVPACEIVVTNKRKQLRRMNMSLSGKGQPGRITHIKRGGKKSAAQANNGNLELPGVETDQRRIKEIEESYEAYEAQSKKSSRAISKAHEDLDAAKEAVVTAMHAKGFNAGERPVYSRPPWGTVTLQKRGKVDEVFKFAPGQVKPKKKKGEDVEPADDDDEG